MPASHTSLLPSRDAVRGWVVAVGIAAGGVAVLSPVMVGSAWAQAESAEALKEGLVDAAGSYNPQGLRDLMETDTQEGSQFADAMAARVTLDARLAELQEAYVAKFGQEAWDGFSASQSNIAALSTPLSAMFEAAEVGAGADGPTFMAAGTEFPLAGSEGAWYLGVPAGMGDSSGALLTMYESFGNRLARAEPLVASSATPEAFAEAFLALPEGAAEEETVAGDPEVAVSDPQLTVGEMEPDESMTETVGPAGLDAGGGGMRENDGGPMRVDLDGPMVAVPADQLEAVEPTERARELMDDFGHYTLIARPELAMQAGQALLQEVRSPAELVAVVEESRFGENIENLLTQLSKPEVSREFADQMRERIFQARVYVSRDPARTRQAVEALILGPQAYRRNVLLLREAGQFAAPALLEALQSRDNVRLRGTVRRAIPDIGESVALPLSIALPYQDPEVQKDLAQALAEIGYPVALPYIKQAMESSRITEVDRGVLGQAFDRIAALNNRQVKPASELFVDRSEELYRAGTIGQTLQGLDPAADTGWVWQYLPDARQLLALEVPEDIHPDVLTMQAATSALTLEPTASDALMLFLASNLRRENRLPEGASDATYSQEMRPPTYYLQVAGPQQQNRVLDRALKDGDAALALDAIAGLEDTAGVPALLALEGGQGPLLRALDNPNRLVRIRAAMALAAARPDRDFSESYCVVRELSDAAGADDTPHVILIAPSTTRDAMQAEFRNAGFDVIAGGSLAEVAGAAADRPGIDLLVLRGSVDEVRAILDETATDFRFAAVPVLGVTGAAEAELVRTVARNNRRLSISRAADDPAGAVADARTAIEGSDLPNLTDEQRLAMATRALELLREAAVSSGVFKVQQGQAALQATLNDPRPEVASGAGRVLAMLDDADAQAAIAEAALTKSGPVQVSLLSSLAESARRFGNMLDESTTNRLTELVRTATDELALAASQAHGALSLPTQNAVQNILADENGGDAPAAAAAR